MVSWTFLFNYTLYRQLFCLSIKSKRDCSDSDSADIHVFHNMKFTCTERVAAVPTESCTVQFQKGFTIRNGMVER